MLDWFSTQLGFSVALIVILIAVTLTVVGYSTFFERKVSAWLQDRLGPNRAGPKGVFQPLADGMKFLLKEEFIPRGADRRIFILAPMLSMGIALLGIAVIPWGGLYQPAGTETILRVQIASVDIGLLFVLAVGAMSIYGIVLGSWASNNKYSFYGGMRAAAQMLSYEVPLGLAILVVVLTVGELRLEEIVAAQSESGWGWLPKWNILLHPVTFGVLVITSLAETNRAPFDLAECEQELVGGFHTEYSSMKFAMFFLGEYTHMIVSSAFITVLFLGGWHVPGLDEVQTTLWGVLLQVGVLWAKIVLFIFLFMWIRWTLPRFRFDQLMRLCWKGLVPLMLGMVAVTCLLLYTGWAESILSPLAEIAVVMIMAVVVILRPGRVTGRQEHLLAVSHSPKSVVVTDQ